MAAEQIRFKMKQTCKHHFISHFRMNYLSIPCTIFYNKPVDGSEM